MEWRTRNTNKILDIATARIQQDIARNKDGPHQTYGIQRIFHDI